MLSELRHRGRSLSPDFHLPRFNQNDFEDGAYDDELNHDDDELDHDVDKLDQDDNDDDVPCRHVDSLIRQSRAHSMVNH